MKNVLVISTSLRANSNSEALAQAFAEGARESGNNVEVLSLRGKQIGFCRGCMACMEEGASCVIKDDAREIASKLHDADVVAFATPVYYYGMAGQMKTMLDRANCLYGSDYRFRNVYLLTVAAEDEENTPEKTVVSVQGWLDCFPEADFAGSVFAGGVTAPGDIEGHKALADARAMGAAC